MMAEENRKPNTAHPEAPFSRRNFFGGLWHGAFLALGMALTQPATVLPAFIVELTGSTVWVGGLTTVLAVAGALPQLFVARWIDPLVFKKPYLLLAIYVRVLSWGLLAWLIYLLGGRSPLTLAWILVGILVLFYAGGGLGNVPFTDIIGKIIPPGKRGAFFGGRGALAAPLSIGAALAAQQILAHVAYPENYAWLFGSAAVSLGIASLGFWIIREPPSPVAKRRAPPWRDYRKQVTRTIRRLNPLTMAQLLTGFSLMALPFYVVYAREKLGAPTEAVGWFLLAQVLGGIIFNMVWAHLVDRSGSRRMLFLCAVLSFSTPLLAIALSPLGWPALLPIFFLAGGTSNGRAVGFQSALLELSPADERGTYAGLNETLILPVAFLPLAAGVFLQYGSYTALFLLTAACIGAGAIVIGRWPVPQKA
ncbi:MAG: MFS transporter [Anaerolineales bacterium]|nr:MFS transporter [Anaerolineales bacterium]